MTNIKKTNMLEPVNVNSIIIRKDHYFPGAYTIDFPLDSEPDHIWQDIFEREWKTSKNIWDRKIFIIGDTLRLVTTPDEIKEKIDWVKKVVFNVNEKIDTYNKQTELTAKTKPESQKLLIEHDEVIEGIRKAIRSILRVV